MGDELHFEHLNDKNYCEWKVYMEAHFIRKSLWVYVDGTEGPPEGEEGTKKVKDFQMKQLQMHIEIILHVTPLQLPHCASTNPAVIWSTLANIHTS
ncbi:hypothetical protein P691DRAFT_682013 [Macrolepiota fuliginosa MF-IS2]|uniref:DUF4219 domain-containing protein n=1 Tax=Macrolepiota fuliginosa MF-IS2 TaxID=1400762 RepID=A0A9P6BVU2_9AGAR|nr:hypothetical protein P691DRAFT_682013 [Macrolepiota fuliginosa MF-IS2]